MSVRRIAITTRITLFAGTVAALLFALVATGLMIAINRFADQDVTEEITAAGGRVAVQMERGRLDYPLVEHKSRNVQIVDPRGRVVASTPSLQGKPRIARFTPGEENVAGSQVCGGVFPRGQCNIVVAQWAHRAGERFVVYTASPTVAPLVDPQLAALVGGSAVLLTAFVTYLGHRITSAALKPVTAIRAQLDVINVTRPDHRVPVPPSDDEIRDLAESVNQTLARLNATMEQQRQFASDASHDLRSPLAAIRAEVEDALCAPQETSVTKVGHAILGSMDRLQALADSLMTITRLDAGEPAACNPIDLADLAAAECRMHQYTSKRFECSLEPGVVVLGDRMRLGRLLTNLIDNADRHADSTITINLTRAPSDDRDRQRFPQGVAVLEVIDDGPGIDPDKREVVFQRFTRLDAARNKDAGGSGLGLPIARQIAEETGGTLRIEDSARGARFVLRLPLHQSATAPLV
jgi:signal transduction histidine kinase